MKDVQCYELFGGIALKNHAFSFHFIFIYEINEMTYTENSIFQHYSQLNGHLSRTLNDHQFIKNTAPDCVNICLSFFYFSCFISLLYNCFPYYVIVQFNCSILNNLLSYISNVTFLALLSIKIAFRYIF